MSDKNMVKKKLEQIYKLNSSAHSVYTIHYHIIQCVKYRRRVFCFQDINLMLEQRVEHICKSWSINLKAFGVDLNHFHILIEVQSDFDMSKFMNNLKTSTSKYLRNRYSFLKRAIPKCLWSPSYCIISCGNVPLPVVQSYVNNQGKAKH